MSSQTLSHSFPNITKTPGVCGGKACISNTRIPVWVLVGYYRLGSSDDELLQCYPRLKPADLANAWKYAKANPDEIEQAIRENEEA